jgi:hypothetical protein
MSGEDFVNVRLTDFGAGLGQVTVHEGPREFVFKPGSVQRVTRAFEWERILSRQEQDGKKLFEIAPDEPKPVKKTVSAKDPDKV